MRHLIESGMSTASAAALGAPGTATQHDTAGSADSVASFDAAVRTLSPSVVGQAAARLVREHGPAKVWTDIFLPYMQALGRQWERTGAGVECEHVAVAAVQLALRTYASRQTGRARSIQVMAAAVPGEAHTLPLDALAAALAEVGYATGVLYDVPESALYAAVQRHPDAIVVLWARARADTAILRGLRTLTHAVYAAGPGWRRARLPKPVSHLASLPAAVAELQTLLVGDSDARRVPSGSGALDS